MIHIWSVPPLYDSRSILLPPQSFSDSVSGCLAARLCVCSSICLSVCMTLSVCRSLSFLSLPPLSPPPPPLSPPFSAPLLFFRMCLCAMKRGLGVKIRSYTTPHLYPYKTTSRHVSLLTCGRFKPQSLCKRPGHGGRSLNKPFLALPDGGLIVQVTVPLFLSNTLFLSQMDSQTDRQNK